MSKKIHLKINPVIKYKGCLIVFAIAVKRFNSKTNKNNIELSVSFEELEEGVSFNYTNIAKQGVKKYNVNCYIPKEKYVVYLSHLTKLFSKIAPNAKLTESEKEYLEAELANEDHFYDTNIKTDEGILEYINSFSAIKDIK